ncbi:MAG: hypothetical protein ACT4P3_07260 [Betaproteobacteria bacterium]
MRAVPIALLAAALGGCGAAPLEYRAAQDLPEGPGMFSGAAGAFVFRAGPKGFAWVPPARSGDSPPGSSDRGEAVP